MSVIYHDMKGDAGEKFNGKIIDIDNPVSCITGESVGCGFFTVLPISEREYRKTHKTEARYVSKNIGTKTHFIVFDDWGKEHQFTIDNSDPALNRVFDYFAEEHVANE